MSSNLSITRFCQYCGNEFQAKTTVTKYCSETCGKRAYKVRKRQEKIQISNEETEQIRNKPLEQIKFQDYLTVRDASILLKCHVRTIYSMISSGRVKAANLSVRKIRIHKSEIERIFNSPTFVIVPNAVLEKKLHWNENTCYKIGEVSKVFEISEAALYWILKRNNVTKVRKGKCVLVQKEVIHSLLGTKLNG